MSQPIYLPSTHSQEATEESTLPKGGNEWKRKKIWTQEPVANTSYKQREFSDGWGREIRKQQLLGKEQPLLTETSQRRHPQKMKLIEYSVCLKCNDRRFRELGDNLEMD